MMGILGILAVLLVAFLLSENRKKIEPRKIIGALGLQLVIAALLLKVPGVREWVALANRALGAIEAATTQASALLFGYLGGGPLPFQEVSPGGSFIVAFNDFWRFFDSDFSKSRFNFVEPALFAGSSARYS